MEEFSAAAFPWLAIGIAVAVILASFNKTKKNADVMSKDTEKAVLVDNKDNYMTIGMCLGMCFGSVLSIMGLMSVSYGICFGMLAGMTVDKIVFMLRQGSYS